MMKLAPAELERRSPLSNRCAVLPPPQSVVLSNGRYSVRLTEVGSGYSQIEDVAVSRWVGDEVGDGDGFHLYLRDLDDDFVWSAGYQPTRATPTQYDFRFNHSVAEISRLDRDIECRMTVFIAPRHDVEVRLCRLTNRSDVARRIEVTSYLEWVLGPRDADVNHPAFSKLFVETQFCRERRAILARRRPRHSDDPEFWGFHSIACDGWGDHQAPVQFETNRLRFIGRGRSLHSPLALVPGAKLSGDWGPVLDPIASLRLTVALEAGESREIAFLLGGGPNRAAIDDMLRGFPRLVDIHRELADTAATGSSNGQPMVAARPAVAYLIPEESYRPAAVEIRNQRAAQEKQPELLFDNGYGGFTPDGQEYVIRIPTDGRGNHRRPPMPWSNVIANEQAGFLVTESGAGYTWSGNSRANRLTAWHNDPVCDPHAEAIWIRDDDAGVFWSPTPGPTPAAADYQVRHGFGYTVFEHASHELSQELTLFMVRDEPVKIARLRVVNRSGRARRLSVFSYVHWALGGLASETAIDITTSYGAAERAIWATNPHRELYGESTAFLAPVVSEPHRCEISYSCDRAAFVGRYRDLSAPAALVSSDELDGRTGQGIDPCAAWQISLELPPGETFECAFVLGEAADANLARKLVAKYADDKCVERALAGVQQFWRETLTAIEVETPDRELDVLVNGWLAYQNLSCRMWARSAYYQPGGAFGFRDQLQDSAALIYHRPEITRAQILRHASQQFVEGDVLHWWHPDTEYGLRTRFSDDLLWLPLVAAEYVKRTGDDRVFDEESPFIAAPPLANDQQEAYLQAAPAPVTASVYEHCCRALDRGLTSGRHGLPLIGCGDWNDGFSRVGRLGQGESVWLGFFTDYVLQQMLPICAARGDHDRVARYTDFRTRLAGALNSAGWDGAWYRRAFYDNGQPIGSVQSDECQIDALAQAWAVISGVASPQRAQMAIRAVEDRLVSPDAGLIRLLTPPFNDTPNDPGYIKGYLPGIRENGGQYTHGVLWIVRALAELGRGTRAVELLRMLTPVWHARSKADVETYQTEPYVVAADVYGEPPHVGRGGWTWYTGSAGWMFRVAVESILGFSTENGDTLVMNPSISAAWPQCRLKYRLPDGNTRFEITIENPAGKERGVTAATLDGRPVEITGGAARVPIARDGELHRIVVRL